MGHVAQGPEPLVREAVVVPLLLFGGEPEPPQLVLVFARRQGDPVVAVHRLAVGAAAAMRDPRARARPHDGLDRRDEPAGGPPHHHLAALAVVDVRFAVGHHDHLVAPQLGAQQGLEPCGRPFGIGSLAAAELVLEVAQARAQVRRDGGELGRGGAERPHQPFPAQQCPRTGDPAAPAQLRHHHGDDRDDPAQADDQDDQVLAGVLAAPLDEAQVVHQHQVSHGAGLRVDRVHAHVDGAAFDAQLRIGLLGHAGGLFAPQFLRVVRRALQQLPGGRTPADRHQPLVLDGPVEQRLQLAPARVLHGVGDRLGQCVGHQHATHVQVPCKPAQGEPVHQRECKVGGGGEDHHQGHQESQLQVECSHRGKCTNPHLESVHRFVPGMHRKSSAYPQGCAVTPPGPGRTIALCHRNPDVRRPVSRQ